MQAQIPATAAPVSGSSLADATPTVLDGAALPGRTAVTASTLQRNPDRRAAHRAAGPVETVDRFAAADYWTPQPAASGANPVGTDDNRGAGPSSRSPMPQQRLAPRLNRVGTTGASAATAAAGGHEAPVPAAAEPEFLLPPLRPFTPINDALEGRTRRPTWDHVPIPFTGRDGLEYEQPVPLPWKFEKAVRRNIVNKGTVRLFGRLVQIVYQDPINRGVAVLFPSADTPDAWQKAWQDARRHQLSPTTTSALALFHTSASDGYHVYNYDFQLPQHEEDQQQQPQAPIVNHWFEAKAHRTADNIGPTCQRFLEALGVSDSSRFELKTEGVNVDTPSTVAFPFLQLVERLTGKHLFPPDHPCFGSDNALCSQIISFLSTMVNYAVVKAIEVYPEGHDAFQKACINRGLYFAVLHAVKPPLPWTESRHDDERNVVLFGPPPPPPLGDDDGELSDDEVQATALDEEKQAALNQVSLKEVLQQIRRGELRPLDIPPEALKNHPEMARLQHEFNQTLTSISDSMFHCPSCKHRFFDLKPRPSGKGGPLWCQQCTKEANEGVLRIPKFGRHNDMDPFPDGYPFDLPKLTMIEEMLIAPINVWMTAYMLKNGSFGYTGHVLNVMQRVQDVADQIVVKKLPHRVVDLNVVIVKKPSKSAPSGFKDFKVSRAKIEAWMKYLCQHSPFYEDIEIDQAALDELPGGDEGGCVVHMLRVLDEPSNADTNAGSNANTNADSNANNNAEDSNADSNANANANAGSDADSNSNSHADSNANSNAQTDSSANTDSNADSSPHPDADSDDDLEPPNQQLLGPEQGGATGLPYSERPIEELFVAPPPTNSQAGSEEAMVDDLGRQMFDWPEQGEVVNEYTVPGLYAMAFPTLFPHGLGDCTKRGRRIDLTPTQANKHLLLYCFWDRNERRFVYPFAEHNRFGHWAHNIVERHRANGQRSYWLQQSEEFGDLSVDELEEIFKEKGDKLKRLLGQMQQYNGNINGSHAQMFMHRKNLEALIVEKGTPTFFMSFSAADNHWPDLQACLTTGAHQPTASTSGPGAAAAKERRKLTRLHEHVVGEHFTRRVRALFDMLHRLVGLKYRWHRLELQDRGHWHCHACCRLEGDPNLNEKARAVVQGRDAQRALQQKFPSVRLPRTFAAAVTEDDKWLDRHQVGSCCFEDLAPEELPTCDEEWIELFQHKLDEGIDAHDVLVSFQMLFLTALHPRPPADADQPDRLEETYFSQGPHNLHPSAVDPNQPVPASHEADLLDAVMRHSHNPYCQTRKGGSKKRNRGEDEEAPCEIEPARQRPRQRRGQKSAAEISREGKRECCRFDYPHNLTAVTHLVVQQTYSRTNGALIQVEMKPQRNDRWLNAYSSPILFSWKANFDMRLTVDMGKIALYMTKYMTKAEKCDPRAILRVSKAAIAAAKAGGRSSGFVLRKVMSSLLGERSRPKTEIFHLMLSGSIVECSHQFKKVNLKNDTRRLLPTLDATDDADADAAGNEGAGDGTRARGRATKMTTMDAYARRMDASLWGVLGEFESYSESELRDMSLFEFCSGHYVGERQGKRNKIFVMEAAKKIVTTYFPEYSSVPDRPDYPKYCEMALIKHKPWIDSPATLWEGQGDGDNVGVGDGHHAGAGDSSDDGESSSRVPSRDKVQLWHEFVQRRRRAKKPIPGLLQRDVDLALAALDKRMRTRLNLEAAAAVADGCDIDGDVDVDADVEYDSDYDSDDEEVGDRLEWSGRCPELPGGILDALDDDEDGMEWDKDVYEPIPEHAYEGADHFREGAKSYFESLVKKDRPSETGAAADGTPPIQLNEMQQVAHDHIVRLALAEPNRDGGPTGKCAILAGKGGTGKTTTINAITRTLEGMHPGSVRKLATTGKAADNIRGSTLHSRTHGLALPIRGKSYRELPRIHMWRTKWGTVRIIFIDEFSMLRQQELCYIDKRLRELFDSTLPFGGVTVILAGDTGQIPPVGGHVLWDAKPTSADEWIGLHLYEDHFTGCVILLENNRVVNDTNAKEFLEILDRLRTGTNTYADWKKVGATCHRSEMGERRWQAKFPRTDALITYLFTNNKDVNKHNHQQLRALGAPIALVEAEHSCSQAKRLSPDEVMGLEKSLYLAEGAKVYLTINAGTEFGLSNGSAGVVMKVIYAEGTRPPALPVYVLVDFGESYRGEPFFPGMADRDGWVPVYPMKAVADKNPKLHRTMIPLKLAYAWTIWKAQGQTYTGLVVINLSNNEPEHGITYVAFSRVTKLENLGIDGNFSLERFTSKVRNHAKVEPRLLEEARLRRLAEETLERHRRQQQQELEQQQEDDEVDFEAGYDKDFDEEEEEER